VSKGVKFPSVRFTLKSEKGPEKLILSVFRYHGKKLVYSTKLKINESHWDRKRQVPKNVFKEYEVYRSDLYSIQNAITAFYTSLSERKREVLSLIEFKEHLDMVLGRKEKEKNNSSFLTDFVEDYLERRGQKVNSNKSTLTKYKNTLKHLKGFENAKKLKLSYDDINWSFKDHFCNYLYQEPRKHSQNTVHKHVKILKLFMREAKKEGLHSNSIYEHRDYTVGALKVKKVYLTKEDLDKLKKLDLSECERLDRVRDLFLLSCYSGLRYSDFVNIKKENLVKIEGFQFLNVYTKKTGTEILIPFTDDLDKILKKYGYNSPKPLSNQRMNDYIKEVCNLARIDDPILYQYSEGGRRVQKHVKKYELCSNHTGRRTWASLMYLEGYSIGLLRAVLGHSSDSIFLAYVGAEKKDFAIQLAKEMANKHVLRKVI